MSRYKIIYSLLISVFIVNANWAQNVLSYRNLIKNAELSICDSNFKKAADLYNTAFNSNSYKEAKDIHNAVMCNILIGNIKKSIQLSKNLIEYGADSLYFYRNDNFRTMLENKRWVKQIINTQYFQNKGLSVIDTALRSELLRRFIKDQDLNNPKRKEVISENSAWFKEMLLKKQFPSQSKVGIFTKNNTIENNPYEIMLIHYFDNLTVKNKNYLQSDSLKLAELLYKLVQDGDMNPYSFAILNNVGPSYNLTPFNKQYFWVVGESVYVIVTDKDRLLQVNQERLKNGMHTMEDYMRIIRFNAFDKRFYLTSGNCIGVFPDFMEEDFNRKGSKYKNIGNKKEVLNIK